MADIFLLLSALPMWLIYGAMCGFFGGVSIWLSGKITSLIVIRLAISAMAIVLSAIFTGSYLRPNIYAEEFRVGVLEILGDLPKQIDDSTRLDEFYLDMGKVFYRYSLTTEIEDVDATKALLKRSIYQKDSCQDLIEITRPFASEIVYFYTSNLGDFTISLTDETCRK